MQVRTSFFLIVALSALLFSGCGNKSASVEAYVHPGWDTLSFGDWTMQAPEGFAVQFSEGADSAGVIVYDHDDLQIKFDTWGETDAPDVECTDSDLYDKMESNLEWSEEFYSVGNPHDVWEDKINGRYVVLTKPQITGYGTVGVYFSECHHSLAVQANNLTKEQEALVLEMFRTIDWKGKQAER